MNPQSKEYKKVKFKNAPTALIVYVADKKDVKNTRRKPFDCFGEVDKNGL